MLYKATGILWTQELNVKTKRKQSMSSPYRYVCCFYYRHHTDFAIQNIGISYEVVGLLNLV